MEIVGMIATALVAILAVIVVVLWVLAQMNKP